MYQFQVYRRRGKWLKKLTVAKCLCFVPLVADFMGILVQMACVQCATKNIFKGRTVMVELALLVSNADIRVFEQLKMTH